tara:strand:+ start:330 stop:563 length:234 start_codon:yes stop_codon:yes gene_type:complete
MKNFNNKNIKNILLILEQGTSTLPRLIKLSERKFNISKLETINSLNLLLDLKVIEKVQKNSGDGWNTSGKVEVFNLS